MSSIRNPFARKRAAPVPPNEQVVASGQAQLRALLSRSRSDSHVVVDRVAHADAVELMNWVLVRRNGGQAPTPAENTTNIYSMDTYEKSDGMLHVPQRWVTMTTEAVSRR